MNGTHPDSNVTTKAMLKLFDEHRLTPIPRKNRQDFLQDLDVDLYLADDYITGLMYVFIARKTLSNPAIIVNLSLSERLSKIVARTADERRVLEAFNAYNARIEELSFLLSNASGLPIEFVNTE